MRAGAVTARGVAFAYVIAEHLAPQKSSALVELLSRQTLLDVRFAVSGSPLERGVVLVGPPGTDVVVDRMTVQLLAPTAAVRPRTALGKTSPWISHPVPPAPIANEVMKNEKPIMATHTLGSPVRCATPSATTRMNTAMPA